MLYLLSFAPGNIYFSKMIRFHLMTKENTVIAFLYNCVVFTSDNVYGGGSELLKQNIYPIIRSSYFTIITKFFNNKWWPKGIWSHKKCAILMKLTLWLARALYTMTRCLKEVHFARNQQTLVGNKFLFQFSTAVVYTIAPTGEKQMR